MKGPLGRDRIVYLLNLLNSHLEAGDSKGEIYLVGGAVMCLVLNARESTQDLDDLFLPASELRKCAREIAQAEDLPEDWLNDAAKGYLSENSQFEPYLQLSHLSVLTASPEYLLAMKSLAMRLGQEFHDLSDVRFLLRYLNISCYKDALRVLEKYYPLKRFPQKTLYVLEELLEDE